MFSRSFDTRSFPISFAATLAVLPSMLLFPKAPFDLSVLPIYVARVPAAPFTHCFPRRFTLNHLHGPVLAPGRADLHFLAALPSTRAIETRSLPSSLAATHRDFAFY